MPPKTFRRRATTVPTPPPMNEAPPTGGETVPNPPPTNVPAQPQPPPVDATTGANIVRPTCPPLQPVPETSQSTEGVHLSQEGQDSTSTQCLAAPPLVITSASAASATHDGEEPVSISVRCKNAEGSATKKQRVIVSNKTNALVKSSGQKIKLQWSSFHKGPDSKQVHDLLVRDIGTAVRGHVPMLASTYAQLEQNHKDALFAYLENMYEIDPTDEEMMSFIRKKAQSRYSQWKSTCRRHYLDNGDVLPSEFRLRPEEWKWLVTKEFEDEKKKALCARNQGNRTKNPNPINHHSGPTPISYRAEDWLKKGHPAPFVQAALDAYFPCKNGKEQVDKLKRSLEEITQGWDQGQASTAEADPESVSQPVQLSIERQRSILIDCFGERRGTEVRGLGGAGTRPAKPRGGPWNAEAVAKRKELEERARKAEEGAQKAREESEKAKEDARKAIERIDMVLRENKSLNSRVTALEEFMTTFAKSHQPPLSDTAASQGPSTSHGNDS